MKRVRGLDTDGTVRGVVNASDVSEETRYQGSFCCLDPDCGATYHWVKGYRRHENTEIVSPTFARDAKSKHKDGCDFDCETKVSRHRDVAFMRDGKFYLRINFPLGSSPSMDIYAGRLTRQQREAAAQNGGKKSVASMEALCGLLHKEFGSLDSSALDNLVLEYQGKSYAWPDVFASELDYGLMHRAHRDRMDETRAILAVVRPHHESTPNHRGKRRFTCEISMAGVDGIPRSIRPVIVCESDEVAEKIESGKTLLLSARPYIVEDMLRKGGRDAQDLPVFLFVYSATQMSAMPATAPWRPVHELKQKHAGQMLLKL